MLLFRRPNCFLGMYSVGTPGRELQPLWAPDSCRRAGRLVSVPH